MFGQRYPVNRGKRDLRLQTSAAEDDKICKRHSEAVLRNVANTILTSVRCRPASVLCPKLEQVVLDNHENVVDEHDDYNAHRYAPNDSHKRSTITARFALLFVRQ